MGSELDKVIAMLGELDASEVCELSRRMRRIAGPWEPNSYDPGHQWKRIWQIKLNGPPPPVGVGLQRHDGREAGYFVYDSYRVHSWHPTLEGAKQAADALLVEMGWHLLEEDVAGVDAKGGG